jgi:carboxymethylenebutenolidase
MPSTTVRIPIADGDADAILAVPGDGGRHPGVLLYPDAFGLRPVLTELARELAGHGYCVLVPNLYYRHGPAPVVELPAHIGEDVRPAVFDRLLPFIQAHGTDRIRRDADAYLDFLTGRPEVGAGPVGVLGYCLGASLALRTAAAHPAEVAALAGFHPGFLVTAAPDSPHRLLGQVTAEVYLGLSGQDMSAAALDELRLALTTASVEHTVETYPDTIHGYAMADTDAFSPAGLRRHWDRLLPLLERTLRTG